jgi:hypothetical protein
MRTHSFSCGDSGDTGDKPVFAPSGRIPTAEKASGDTGSKLTRHEAGRSCLSALSPGASPRVGHTETLYLLGCPHCPQLSPQEIDEAAATAQHGAEEDDSR